jgi:hypothetical protein
MRNKPFKKPSLKWNRFLGFGGKKRIFRLSINSSFIAKESPKFFTNIFHSLKRNQYGNNI